LTELFICDDNDEDGDDGDDVGPEVLMHLTDFAPLQNQQLPKQERSLILLFS
jgi:hypothetical protein